MPNEKFVYMFSEGGADMIDQLGSKGAHLAEMTKLSFPVPIGFTITCNACLNFFKNPHFLETIGKEIEIALSEIEERTGKKFGVYNGDEPLLLSVRSGAPISMPGMMDTVLNVGINEETMEMLAKKTGDKRFALDTYRRFIEMFSDVVMGIDRSDFQKILDEEKKKIGAKATDADLTCDNLREIIKKYKALYEEIFGGDFPEDPKTQLYESIRAVFESWDRPRTKFYRDHHKVPNCGTAVSIQEMVFGNLGKGSFTGVAFTRDPSTGEKTIMGEYLPNAQGEDVLTGFRTPKKLSEMKKESPEIFNDLKSIIEKLEKHYRDMQAIEFTAENGKLYLLQTRSATRTPIAEVKIAIDMMHEGLINEKEAILRIDPNTLSLFKKIDENVEYEIIAKGINASPGAVSGQIVFGAEDAEQWAANGKDVILVRNQTKTDDIHGIIAAKGLVTAHGGKTSHAIVLVRGMGKPAVCGANNIRINREQKYFKVGRKKFSEGDFITIDGTLGIVAKGIVPIYEPEISKEFEELMQIADKIRVLEIRVNTESPEDAKYALELGAKGIGLTRTERMFSLPERLPIVKDIMLARSSEERSVIVKKLKPMQKADFKELFKVMEGHPVTIRLLDPPLQDFLPALNDILVKVAILRYRKKLGGNVDKELGEQEKLLSLVQLMNESHPMLGMRGCRLGIILPMIYLGQVEAIFEAACELKLEGVNAIPEVMVPLIGFMHEIKTLKDKLCKHVDSIIKKYGVELEYKFGSMIETPRSALIADDIAKYAEFFSVGTNDLTQLTVAFSRADAEEKFLPKYLEKNIIQNNPFEILDWKGTGKLIKMAIDLGRKTRPDLICGVTGAHGGNPESIEFFHKIGMDYISCLSNKIPVARLAAAQAQMKFPRKKKK